MDRGGDASWTAVIFDLDGTICDSAPGVVGSIIHAFLVADLAPPPRSELLTWLGPPMLTSLRDYGLPELDARRVHEFYRQHYDTEGVLESTAFSGMPGLLARLSAAGVPLAIATSKPEAPTRLLLDHLELTQYFHVVQGARPDSHLDSKPAILAESLRLLSEAGADVASPVMVGDRHHDVDAARALGISSIFVLWGYGSLDESRGSSAVAASIVELADLLGVG